MILVLAVVIALFQSVAALPSVRDFNCGYERKLLDGNMRILWCMEDVYFKVMVQAKTKGWVGFGLSTVTDSLEKSDYIYGFVNEAGQVKIKDANIEANGGKPVEDTAAGGKYDLAQFQGWEEDDWTTVAFKRVLDTKDAKDVVIDLSKPIKVFISFGANDVHGEALPAANTVHTIILPYSSLSNFAQATEYRTIDGRGNNVDNPNWGTPGDVYVWKNKNDYANGMDTPAGANRPPVRNISNTLFSRQDQIQSIEVSGMIVYYGQLLAHDVSMTSGSAVATDEWPIVIPKCDPTFDLECAGPKNMGFGRSAWDAATGTSTTNPRQQTNAQTSYMDASHVYGQYADRADKLRSHVNGKMLLDEHGLLPAEPVVDMAAEAQCPCNMRKAGDARANVHSLLFTMHTIFVREHNRWCDVLHELNPTWDDEVLYQEARRRVVAIWQKISIYEYLPAVLGGPPQLWSAYDKTVIPKLTHEFNVCGFRYGHSELSPTIPRIDRNGQEIKGGHLLLHENLFDAINGMHENKMEPGIRGVARQRPGKVDTIMVPGARNFLFGNPRGSLNGAFDLAARSMQRGRDHGIRDYNSVREDYGMSKITSWNEVIENDEDTVSKLQTLFPDINDVDLYVGGLAEQNQGASLVGPLYKKILEHDFTTLRDGDRFWFENGQFSDEELKEILDTRFADVIRRNTELTDLDLQDNVFFLDRRYTAFNVIKSFPTSDGYPDTQGYTYDNSLIIMEDRYKLLWSADDSKVNFMVQVKTNGWVGIGFNPNQRGVMVGADIIIARVLSSGVEVKDYKAIKNVGKPAEDGELGGKDDLTDIEGWTLGEWTVVRFSRLRDTKDTKADTVISRLEDTYTIFAYQAETTDFMYHGSNVRGRDLKYAAAQLSKHVIATHTDGQRTLSIILSVMGILLAISFSLFQVIHRKKPTIIFSSPPINNILLLGAVMGYASIPFFALDSDAFCDSESTYVTLLSNGAVPQEACGASATTCGLRQWLLSIGFTLMFGAMFSKTYRVYRLFVRSTGKAFERVKIRNMDLYKIVAILLSVDAVLLTMWSTIDPLKIVRTFTGVQSITPEYLTQEVTETCRSESDAFWVFVFGYKAVLLVLSAVMANATKEVEIPDMRDFTSIGTAIYSILMICFVVLPALSLLEGNVDASFILSVGSVFLSCTSTLLILFIPKVQDIYFGTGGQRSQLKVSSKVGTTRTPSRMNSVQNSSVGK